jgi:hypothetical protein
MVAAARTGGEGPNAAQIGSAATKAMAPPASPRAAANQTPSRPRADGVPLAAGAEGAGDDRRGAVSEEDEQPGGGGQGGSGDAQPGELGGAEVPDDGRVGEQEDGLGDQGEEGGHREVQDGAAVVRGAPAARLAAHRRRIAIARWLCRTAADGQVVALTPFTHIGKATGPPRKKDTAQPAGGTDVTAATTGDARHADGVIPRRRVNCGFDAVLTETPKAGRHEGLRVRGGG